MRCLTAIVTLVLAGCSGNPCLEGQPLPHWPGPWQNLSLPLDPDGAVCSATTDSLEALYASSDVPRVGQTWATWAEQRGWQVEPRLENSADDERVIAHYLHGDDAMTRLEVVSWVDGTTRALLLRRDDQRPPDRVQMKDLLRRLDTLRQAATELDDPQRQVCPPELNTRVTDPQPLIFDLLQLNALADADGEIPDVALVASPTGIEAFYPKNREDKLLYTTQRTLLTRLGSRDLLFLAVTTSRVQPELGLEAQEDFVGHEYVALRRGELAGWILVWDEQTRSFACQAPFSARNGQFGALGKLDETNAVRQDLSAQTLHAATLALQEILPAIQLPAPPETP